MSYISDPDEIIALLDTICLSRDPARSRWMMNTRVSRVLFRVWRRYKRDLANPRFTWHRRLRRSRAWGRR